MTQLKVSIDSSKLLALFLSHSHSLIHTHFALLSCACTCQVFFELNFDLCFCLPSVNGFGAKSSMKFAWFLVSSGFRFSLQFAGVEFGSFVLSVDRFGLSLTLFLSRCILLFSVCASSVDNCVFNVFARSHACAHVCWCL